MATLANLRTRVSAVLGISADVAAHADQTEADNRANEAVRDILLRTGVKVSSVELTLTAGTKDYTLDDETLLIKEVYVTSSSQDYRFEQVSPEEIIRLRRGSTSNNSPARKYALNGTDLFMVWPTPSAADVITIYYVRLPTAMSDATHDPSNVLYGGIPTVFHPAIENYMLWKLADMDDDGSSAQGERYRIRYEGQDGRSGDLARIRKYVNMKGGTRLPRATVGRRGYVPRDPSTDVGW